MKYIRLPLLTALALSTNMAAIPNYSHAQEVVDVITVTANRREQPLSQLGTSVSVLTEADLELAQQNFVLDAMETIPGLSISQNGSFGGTASISIRGAGGNNTVLLMDGVQMNNASAPGNAYNFGSLDTYNISRIEVLRGPQSVLYGSDAIGGVINIITKTGPEGFGGKVFVEGGSFDTQRGGVNIYGGNKKLGFNLSGSGAHTDGISVADENDGNTEKDGLNSFNLSGKITGQLSETVKVELISQYSDNSSKFDDFGPKDGDNVSNINEFLTAGRAYLNLFDDRLSNTLSVEYSSIDRQNLTAGVESYTAKGERFNVDYIGVFEVDKNWTLTGGAQHETVKSQSVSDKSFALNSLLGELAFTGIKGLVLTSGMRYDNHETFGNEITMRVTGSYNFKKTGTRIIANWGEGFKAPSVFQLTYICGFCGQTEPNPDLRPERAKGFEFGIEQPLMDDHLTIGATYFNLETIDAIDFDFSIGYKNINHSRSQGVELTAQAEVTDTLSFTANYTYTDAKNLETGLAFEREPKHLFSGSVIWLPIDGLTTSVNVTRNGAEEQSFGAGTLDAWTRVDLRASYEIYEDLSVYGRIDNVLNEEYQYVLGYGTPDRSYYVGLRKTF